MAFRWFGPKDPIPLRHVRQIPGVETIVSALHDVPVGAVWSRDDIEALQEPVAAAGLHFEVVESLAVHEDIKLGRATRKRLADNYCESIGNLGAAGITVLCYNFMPVFDWLRTDLARQLDDGSRTLAYDDAALANFDLTRGTGELPGWSAAYDRNELAALVHAYGTVDHEQLWDNLAWFLEQIVPAAEQSNVRLALHPDDPPWPVFGLPRIVTSADALERATMLVDSSANGVTFCTGSLGVSGDNDLPAGIRSLGRRRRIHFMHCRNVKRTGDRSFEEVPHPSQHGDVDMLEVMRALHDTGFDGYMRPDHGRMIWDEQGKPGYGLYDRALGATYLQGLWEAVATERRA